MYRNVPWVQIPPSPLDAIPVACIIARCRDFIFLEIMMSVVIARSYCKYGDVLFYFADFVGLLAFYSEAGDGSGLLGGIGDRRDSDFIAE